MRQAKSKKISDEEKLELCEMYKTMSLSKISRLKGYSASAIREWIISTKGHEYYEAHMHSAHDNHQAISDAEMIKMFLTDVPITEIAHKAQITGQTVRCKMKRLVGEDAYHLHMHSKRAKEEMEAFKEHIWCLYMGYDEFGEWNEKNIHTRAEIAEMLDTTVNNVQEIINDVSVSKQLEAVNKRVRKLR